MVSKASVNITKGIGDSNEYIIRDENQIIIGRFTVLELDKENKKSSIKLKFYRKEDKKILNDSLNVMLYGVFKDININKVNLFIDESFPVNAFLDIGFSLEGILFDNLYIQGKYHNELIMGINRNEYNNARRNDYSEIYVNNLTLKILTPEYDKELLNYYIRNKHHLESFEPSRDSSFYTIEVQNKILQESYRQYLSGVSLDFGIFKKDELIGKIKISNIVYGIFKNGILGYSIDKDEQGKGYMKQAVNEIVKYAFEELELHRIEASVLVDNNKSKGVLLSCGFKELGINEKYLFINGKWRDHITYYKVK